VRGEKYGDKQFAGYVKSDLRKMYLLITDIIN